MSSPNIWLSPPHEAKDEKAFVKEALAEQGPYPYHSLRAFEKELEDQLNIGRAVALSSGTAALHLALALQAVGPGDLVFVQDFTSSATINPILYQGAVPVLIGSEPGSWNMSPVHLEEAIEAALEGRLPISAADNERHIQNYKPKAVVPVHLYGLPANLTDIMAIAVKYGLKVVEDAAEAMGANYFEEPVGSHGDMGVYSFGANKIISTGGGGALVSRSEEIIEAAIEMSTPDSMAVEVTGPAYNYRISNLLAGIGRGQLRALQDRVEQRRAVHLRYRRFFEHWNANGYDIRFQEEPVGSFSSRWLTCILINPLQNHGLTREDVHLALKAKNIESRPLWKPMHLQPAYKDFPFFGDDTAEELFNNGLGLPSGSNLPDDDLQRIFTTLEDLFQNQPVQFEKKNPRQTKPKQAE